MRTLRTDFKFTKKEILKERGYIPLTHQEFEEKDLDGFDIILNSRGGKTLKRDYLRMVFGGKLVGLGISDAVTGAKPNWLKVLVTVFQMPKFGAIDLMNDNKSVAGVNALKVFDQKKVVTQALRDLAQFDFSPEVVKVFPPSEIGSAQQFIQDRLANGKVLISWKS